MRIEVQEYIQDGERNSTRRSVDLRVSNEIMLLREYLQVDEEAPGVDDQ